MAFNLDNYETVEDRLKKFWSDNPNGRIETHVAKINDEGTMVIVKALVYKDFDDEKAVATGYAQEYKGQGGFANKEAWLENCETSAIGRALANWKYQGSDKARPSKEEMSKTQGDTTVKEAQSTKPAAKVADKKEEVEGSSASSASSSGGIIAKMEDAGYTVKVNKHEDGSLAIDSVGLWCPCGGSVKYIPDEEKKSQKSPDFRCIMASKCTAGDTVDGKVFSKSWWVDSRQTPKSWNDYAAMMNGVEMPKAKSLDEISPGDAPF
jgi:hypothetical protein